MTFLVGCTKTDDVSLSVAETVALVDLSVQDTTVRYLQIRAHPEATALIRDRLNRLPLKWNQRESRGSPATVECLALSLWNYSVASPGDIERVRQTAVEKANKHAIENKHAHEMESFVSDNYLNAYRSAVLKAVSQPVSSEEREMLNGLFETHFANHVHHPNAG